MDARFEPPGMDSRRPLKRMIQCSTCHTLELRRFKNNQIKNLLIQISKRNKRKKQATTQNKRDMAADKHQATTNDPEIFNHP